MDCENFRKGQYTLIPEGFHLDPYVHAQAGVACATIYLGGRTDWDNHFKPLHSTFKIESDTSTPIATYGICF